MRRARKKCPHCGTIMKGKTNYLDIAHYMIVENDFDAKYNSEELAEHFERSEPSVRKSLLFLESLGYVKVDRGGSHRYKNQYYLREGQSDRLKRTLQYRGYKI